MKQYPSISKEIILDLPVHVFDKLDGSNLRVEWTKNRGFMKFGSRKVLIDPTHELLGRGVAMIKEHEASIAEYLKNVKADKAVCYFEFVGEKSFAGQHESDDPTLRVVLLDVEISKHGFLAPEDFLKAFQGVVPTPDLLYHGEVTEALLEDIRNGTMPGMTFEGVVCKAAAPTKWALPVMFKVKNLAWIEKVKAKYGENAEKYL